jgi:hypothetical protein
MTEEPKPRSESLLIEIRELTDKVRKVRLELEELVKRPGDRSVWRMLSSHGERSVAGDRGRGGAAARPPPKRKRPRPSADPDHPNTGSNPDPDRDPGADR